MAGTSAQYDRLEMLEATKAVAELRRRGLLRQDVIHHTLLSCPRSWFVAESHDLSELYDVDRAIVLKTAPDGEVLVSATGLSAITYALETLKVKRGQRILEIGTGTGYTTGILAAIVGPGGSVVSIDVDEEQCESARRVLTTQGFTNVSVMHGDGFMLPAPNEVFDGILVSCAAPEVASSWLQALCSDGRLVCVIRGSLADVLLVGHKQGSQIQLEEVRAVGGWNQLRSPCQGYAGWFPPRRDRPWSSPARWAQSLASRYCRTDSLHFPVASARGDLHRGTAPWDHPFWLFAELQGFRGLACWVQVEGEFCLYELVAEDSAVRLNAPRPEVESLGSGTLLHEAKTIVAQWQELRGRVGEPRVVGTICVVRDGPWPQETERLGEWHYKGRYTELHLRAEQHTALPLSVNSGYTCTGEADMQEQ